VVVVRASMFSKSTSESRKERDWTLGSTSATPVQHIPCQVEGVQSIWTRLSLNNAMEVTGADIVNPAESVTVFGDFFASTALELTS
jgi:hypothetical protein